MKPTAIKTGIPILLAAIVMQSGSLVGQSFVELQKAREETTVIEKVGSPVSLNARFMDLDGNWYALKEFFYEDRPVFLSLNYANCPQLCQNQLKMLAERFDEAGMVPGEDFEFISISIDPRESQSRTRESRESFCRLMNRDSRSEGVHFLVGKKPDIDAVARSVGFVYSYVPAANHYSHAPLCVALTPNGTISRYIHGLAFAADDLQQSSEIAGQEKVAEDSIASFVFSCLFFIANPGQYSASLMSIMRVAGGITVVVLGACVIPFWLRANRNASGLASDGDNGEAADKQLENGPTLSEGPNKKGEINTDSTV
ncbi:MAG: SCO family protein [Planctomycetota bacterium]|nr:SCO family protein [Planctomycetota bacterium]